MDDKVDKKPISTCTLSRFMETLNKLVVKNPDEWYVFIDEHGGHVCFVDSNTRVCKKLDARLIYYKKE